MYLGLKSMSDSFCPALVSSPSQTVFTYTFLPNLTCSPRLVCRVKVNSSVRGARYPTRPKDIHLENLERRVPS